jgi:hypothetical protein
MTGLNYPAIAAAALAAFVFSGIYYTILARPVAELGSGAAGGSMSVAVVAAELVRSLVVAAVFAGLTRAIGVAGPLGAAQLALALWVGFPAVLLAGSVIHENVPLLLAAIHSGDWLAKLLVISVIVTAWR